MSVSGWVFNFSAMTIGTALIWISRGALEGRSLAQQHRLFPDVETVRRASRVEPMLTLRPEGIGPVRLDFLAALLVQEQAQQLEGVYDDAGLASGGRPNSARSVALIAKHSD